MRRQSFAVGVRSPGSVPSAAPMSASGIPTRWDTLMNATRRSVSRRYLRWLPDVRRLAISPLRS
jgi:hypothetical protein